MTVVALVALGAPLMAQEAGGEANLKLPRLDSVTFLGGISGSNLLMGGLVVSALGLIFGLIIFTRLKNMTKAILSALIPHKIPRYGRVLSPVANIDFDRDLP